MPTILSGPDKIQLRAATAALPGGAVSAAAGTIRGVSLLTGNQEAEGWGIFIDAATLAGFNTLLQGRRLKAYATHDTFGKDGTLDEVGFWANVRVDGDQLRADFAALDAWRTYNPGEFATLFELAQKVPDEFGVSLCFAYSLAWVRKGGAEVATAMADPRLDGSGFNPPAPADALRAMPSVRPIEVYSADFVDDPAANAGLFSKGAGGGNPALVGLARTTAALRARIPGGAARTDPDVLNPPHPLTLHGLARTRAALQAQIDAKKLPDAQQT